ncbi:MAG: NAD-dependent epimerase/dehydratase family protein, partial [Silvanigrellaceae bacterium]|nr:NAD-dependent epimerase/dehydratase family protein [Silvanigrellaceae bacterium]
MKIFLTGANGMVGKNILAHNKANKYQFFNPSKNELNLLSQKNVYNYIEKNSFDLIIHCAGLVGGILENTQNQDKFLIENFEIGKNVIQTA